MASQAETARACVDLLDRHLERMIASGMRSIALKREVREAIRAGKGVPEKPARENWRLTAAEVAEIKRLKEMSVADEDIAAAVGRSTKAVRRAIAS
jgi:hypothetical protein